MARLPSELFDELVDAAAQDRSRAKELLSQHPELITSRGRFGETPLHFLAVEGFADAVRFLGESGADVNAPNESGETPLMSAAIIGNDQVAEVLLALGANPNATSPTLDNVLHAAAGSGNARLVGLLLDAGANPRYRTDLNETVFDALPADAPVRAQILKVLADHGVTEGAV
jgi:ankyrin repeat protein